MESPSGGFGEVSLEMGTSDLLGGLIETQKELAESKKELESIGQMAGGISALASIKSIENNVSFGKTALELNLDAPES